MIAIVIKGRCERGGSIIEYIWKSEIERQRQPLIRDHCLLHKDRTNSLTNNLVRRGCDEGRGRGNEEGKEEEGTHSGGFGCGGKNDE